jgi:hypothetical protein
MPLPAIIDVEASGLTGRSYPVEVGLVTAAGATYCALVLPDPGWSHWDPAAEAVHGITREILQAHGKPITEVAARVNEHLAGTTVYSDAWGNDYAWLARLFDAAELPMRFRVEALRSLLTDAQAALWHATKHRVIAEMALKRHRASSDARALQLTLAALRGAGASSA